MPEPSPPAADRPPQTLMNHLAAAMQVLAAVLVIVWIAWVVSSLLEGLDRDEGLGLPRALELLALLLGGLAAAAALLGLAGLVRSVGASGPSQRLGAPPPAAAEPWADPSPGQAVRGDPASVASATDGLAMSEVMSLLVEIRDNTLLDEAQRRGKLEELASQEIQHLGRQIRQALADGQFQSARTALGQLQQRFPNASDAAAGLQAELDAATAASEDRDVAEATRQVEELMSISGWERAEQLSRQLLDDHPGSDAARALHERVRREHTLFVDEQRGRMFAEVQRYTSRRRWKDALDAAHAFLERFPDSVEAESLRQQMPTLEGNAEIQQRQDLEAQIKDLIRKHRFSEAVELARTVIQTYPNSPQADVLRNQMARLERRAADEEQPPQA